MPGQSARENGKLGGRPLGSKNPQTLERERIDREVRERIGRNAQRILEAQMAVALGNTMAFSKVTGKPVLVTDPEQAQRIVDGDEDGIVLRGVDPDPDACQKLLDRYMGRAKESVEHSGPDGTKLEFILTKK